MAAIIDDLQNRMEAAFSGVLAGAAASNGGGSDDLFAVVESLVFARGFDADELRHRGLGVPSSEGGAGLLMRALPMGLLTPVDRPAIRRHAYNCASMSGADEGSVIAAVVVAVLGSDLLRFDLATSLMRCRQTFLEEAPAPLLDRLRVAPEVPTVEPDAGAVEFLHAAVSALGGWVGIPSVVAALASVPAPGPSLGGALAGLRDGFAGCDQDWRQGVSGRERAASLASGLAAVVAEGRSARTPA